MLKTKKTSASSSSLWKDLSVIVTVKCLALYLLWLIFFSHPLQLTGPKTYDHFFPVHALRESS